MQSSFSRLFARVKATIVVDANFRNPFLMAAQARSVSPLSRTPCDQLVRITASTNLLSASTPSTFRRVIPSSTLVPAPSPSYAPYAGTFSVGISGSSRPRRDVVVARTTLPVAMAAGPPLHTKEQNQSVAAPGFFQQKSTTSGHSRQVLRGVSTTPLRHGSSAVQMLEPEISNASRTEVKFNPQLTMIADFEHGAVATHSDSYSREDEDNQNHMSLNLKYRPKNFKELVGQDAVAKRLKNALDMNKEYSAYLFCGPRGTGKTSAARILATALNCEESRGVRPCGHCRMCKSSMKEHGGPIREIDGATNNGVDDVKSLMENARYASNEPHKVYIIDECHMLSTEAAMQLAKAIGKAPKGVVFILVTTDEDKLPKATVSCCQKFNFKKIQPEVIVKRLRSHACLEHVQVEEEALRLIATLADGSLRDAEMMLERAVICGEEVITAASVEELEGRAPQQQIQELLESIRSVDQSPRVLEITTSLLNEGVAPLTIVNQLAVLVCQLMEACQPSRQHPLSELALRVGGSNALQKLQRSLVAIEERVRGSSARDLWLKMNLCAMAETSADSTSIAPEQPQPSLALAGAEASQANAVLSKALAMPGTEPQPSLALAGAEASQAAALSQAVAMSGTEPQPSLALTGAEASQAAALSEPSKSAMLEAGRADPVVVAEARRDKAGEVSETEPEAPRLFPEQEVELLQTSRLLVEEPAEAVAATEVVERVGEEGAEREGESTITEDAADGKEEPMPDWEELASAVAAKGVRALLLQKGRLVSLTREEAVIQFETEKLMERAQKSEKGITLAFRHVLQREIKVLFSSTGGTIPRGRPKKSSPSSVAENAARGSETETVAGETAVVPKTESVEEENVPLAVQLSGDSAPAVGGGAGSREEEVKEANFPPGPEVDVSGGDPWGNLAAENLEKKKQMRKRKMASEVGTRSPAAPTHNSQEERSGERFTDLRRERGSEGVREGERERGREGKEPRSVGSMAFPSPSRNTSSGAAAKEFMVKKKSSLSSAKDVARSLVRWMVR